MKKLLSRFRRPKVTQTLSAVIVRADGTREDLGVISQTESKRWGVTARG